MIEHSRNQLYYQTLLFIGILTISIGCNWKQKSSKRIVPLQEEAMDRINNIVTNSTMIKFVPAKVKGDMLFSLTKYKILSFSDTWDADPDKKIEAAALIVITNITHGKEWQEVMEHMAVKNDQGECEPYSDSKKHYKEAGRLTRMNYSVQFLRKNFLDEAEYWEQVRKHITNLPEWDKAWNQQLDGLQIVPE